MSMNDLKEYLVKNGVKPSYPRLRVLEYLMRHRNHPTVEDIYSELIREMPTLSKTTVYNTLNLFIEENVAIPISIDNHETRYDATVEDHGHFKCENCGKIYDFSVDIGKNNPEELKGFQIHNRNVYFKGICYGCLKT